MSHNLGLPKIALFGRWTGTYLPLEENLERERHGTSRGTPTAPFRYEACAEIYRIIRERTCRFCESPMEEVPLDDGMNRIFLCTACGYFGANGARHKRVGHLSRGVVAMVEELPLNSPEIAPAHLIRHLNNVPSSLLMLSPSRAERVVMEALKETLQCDVVHVGGVRDKGVDGYIVANDNVRTLVQVNWHRSRARAESVRVIREVAGTMLARGVPRGLLVTTRETLSVDARRETAELTSREVVGVGTIELSAKSYKDVLDMLEIASTRLNDIGSYMSLLRAAALASGFGNITGKVREEDPPV